MVVENETSADDVKCVRSGFERLEDGSDILRSTDCEWRDFDAERTSRGLDLAHLHHRLGIAKVNQHCQLAKPGDDLTQELDPFARNITRLERESSDVAAWFRQTCDQAAAHWVLRYCKDDGNDRCRLFYYGD